MDPLYPPGLDENRAVDDLYATSWICSETSEKKYSAGEIFLYPVVD